MADAYALTLCHTSGLHHHADPARADKFLGGIRIGEGSRFGRWHGLLAHDFLGKPFVRFQPSGFFRRAKYLDARGGHRISHAGCKRVFGTDHNQIDLVLPHEFFDFPEIGDRHIGDIISQLRCAGIARQGIEGRHARRSGQFPREGMFASAISDEQYSHYRAAYR